MVTQWKTLAQVAEHLQLPEATVYKLKERGQIRGYRVGRSLRFDLEEVDADIKKGAKRVTQRDHASPSQKRLTA